MREETKIRLKQIIAFRNSISRDYVDRDRIIKDSLYELSLDILEKATNEISCVFLEYYNAKYGDITPEESLILEELEYNIIELLDKISKENGED